MFCVVLGPLLGSTFCRFSIPGAESYVFSHVGEAQDADSCVFSHAGEAPRHPRNPQETPREPQDAPGGPRDGWQIQGCGPWKRRMQFLHSRSSFGARNGTRKTSKFHFCGFHFEAIFEMIFVFREDRPWSKATRVGDGEWRRSGLGNLLRACAF